MRNFNEYINVMVYNFKKTKDNSITLGISNLPYKQNGYPAIDGLKDAKGAINKNSLSLNTVYPSTVPISTKSHPDIQPQVTDTKDTPMILETSMSHWLMS